MHATFEGWALYLERIKCGRKDCHCCPHGPYWYGYRREGSRMKKKYFGKDPPVGAKLPDSPDQQPLPFAEPILPKTKPSTTRASKKPTLPKTKPSTTRASKKPTLPKTKPTTTRASKKRMAGDVKGGAKIKDTTKPRVIPKKRTLPPHFMRIFNKRSATITLAVEILGIEEAYAASASDNKTRFAVALSAYKRMLHKYASNESIQSNDERVIELAWEKVRVHPRFIVK